MWASGQEREGEHGNGSGRNCVVCQEARRKRKRKEKILTKKSPLCKWARACQMSMAAMCGLYHVSEWGEKKRKKRLTKEGPLLQVGRRAVSDECGGASVWPVSHQPAGRKGRTKEKDLQKKKPIFASEQRHIG